MVSAPHMCPLQRGTTLLQQVCGACALECRQYSCPCKVCIVRHLFYTSNARRSRVWSWHIMLAQESRRLTSPKDE